MRARLRPAVVACTAAVALPLAAGLAPAASAADLLTVTQNVLPGLAAATDLGTAPATTPMTLLVDIKRPDVAGEQALLDAEHDPAGPSHGRYLTPARFAARFGVPAAQADAVRSWLTSGGLTVTATSAARDIVTVEGTAGAVSSLLKTPIHAYRASGTAFDANTAAPVLPYALGITNVIGLNTLQRHSTPAQSQCVGTSCLGRTTPADLWSVYDQPAAYRGAGQQLAVFGEGRTDGVIADLRQFEAANNLPQIPVTVKHPAGDTDFSDDSGAQEWDIDTQASSGMAPMPAT